MPIDLHLFSSPGQTGIEDIIEASRPYLEGKSDAVVAYLPLALLYAERWLEPVEKAFTGLADVKTINAELMNQKEIENILRDSSLVYIPGGNTFLLAHRLRVSGAMPYLKKKIQSGLPLIAFSAGTVLCGPNILTANDLNTVSAINFEGLGISPFNYFPHYPLDSGGQSTTDGWLGDYFFFNDNPVVLMSDGAYIKVDGKKHTLVRGEAWIMNKDGDRSALNAGKSISL